MAATGTADPILSQQVIPKITVTATPTAFVHLRSCTFRRIHNYSEVFSPGTSNAINRAVISLDASAELEIYVPSTQDPAENVLSTDMEAGDTSTFTFVEPSLDQWSGEFFAQLEATVQVGERYVKRYSLVPTGTVTLT